MATVDADTLLMAGALERIVARLLISPPDTVAVAGAVFVRNSRRNFLTRAQEWDYFLGIASVKRQQGLFQGTMVAQGAFSVYRTDAVRAVGGWPDRIGEDIVLTWAMMREGGRVGYERTAIAFTGAPEDLRALRPPAAPLGPGMIEGLREHGGALLSGHRSNAHAVLVNFLFPFVDGVYSIAFPIGIVLALLWQLRDRRADDPRGLAAELPPLDGHVPPQPPGLRRGRAARAQERRPAISATCSPTSCSCRRSRSPATSRRWRGRGGAGDSAAPAIRTELRAHLGGDPPPRRPRFHPP